MKNNYFNVEGTYDLRIQGKNVAGEATFSHIEQNVSFVGRVPSTTFNYTSNFSLLEFKRNDVDIPRETLAQWKNEFKNYLYDHPAEIIAVTFFKDREDPKGYHREGFECWAARFKNLKSKTFWIKESDIVKVSAW